MKTLITGAAGFSGRHLSAWLEQQGDGIIYASDIHEQIGSNWHCGDLGDFAFVEQLLTSIRPEQIYHLAGSFSNDYRLDYRSNVESTRNIFEVIRQLALRCRVLLIGTAAEYGLIASEDNPISEEYPLRPVSIYGLTKSWQTQLMQFYWRRYRLDLVMARTFNLIGAGISPRLFIGKLHQQIADYRSHKITAISLGNLAGKRDYLPIAAAVRHYYQIMNHGRSGEIYNVGSGRSLAMRELLDQILAENGLADAAVTTSATRDNEFDVADIYADINRLTHLYSFAPR